MQVFGIPLIQKHKEAKIVLGDHVVLTSLSKGNLAGVNHPVILAAPLPESKIVFGHHSGMSGGTIFASRSVTIGNYVNIGVNVCIYDTDIHSLNWKERRVGDNAHGEAKEIIIEDDVWVGANVIILKGVRIGRGAVVGAGSVIIHHIPEFTVWAGNPAKQVRDVSEIS